MASGERQQNVTTRHCWTQLKCLHPGDLVCSHVGTEQLGDQSLDTGASQEIEETANQNHQQHEDLAIKLQAVGHSADRQTEGKEDETSDKEKCKKQGQVW